VRPLSWCLAALLLVGCAAKHEWRKDGADEAQVGYDLAVCRRDAAALAHRDVLREARQGTPIIEHDLRTGTVREAAGGDRRAAAMTESTLRQRYLAECMRKLGYRLADR